VLANDALTACKTYDAVLAFKAVDAKLLLTAFSTYDADWAFCTNEAVDANEALIAIDDVSAYDAETTVPINVWATKA
jgi:hypothetical protein